jgi:hypothetical protein
MAQRHNYLAKARAVLDGQDADRLTIRDGRAGGERPKPVAREPKAGAPPRERGTPYERNENNEQSLQDDASTTALAMARVRAGLSKRLQHWEDERLQVLVLWNLVIAFDRGSATGFRRHLVPALASLADGDLATLVDWSTLATLEERLWASDPVAAEPVSRGVQRLATWWNARRSRRADTADTETSGRPPARTPTTDERRFDRL